MTEPAPDPSVYPPHWQADALVNDGMTVHLRPITPRDAPSMVAFHAGLSTHTRYLRYFSAYPSIPSRDLVRFSHMDQVNRVALAVWLGREIIAIGRFDRLGPGSKIAEVAFVVGDAHQGRGIGSILLEHLAAAAREVGIDAFEAIVLAENHQMMRVLAEAGYQTSREVDGSEVTMIFDIAATYLTEKVMTEREQRAESRSIQSLLFPRSVAVVGASADDQKIGHLVLENLESDGFTGPIYPVNLAGREINGVRSYRSVGEIGAPVDLAVLTVPASEVADVIADCGRAGVRGLVVISAGFGESGDHLTRAQGVQAQQALVGAARVHGMRVVGPNCLGIINTDPEVALNASLSTITPLRGRAGFFCQSGALGAAVLGEANRRGLGLSTFVSAGNRADVSGNDLLQFWEGDPETEIALLYLESFGNPRKFARLSRRFARRKPIVAVKSGRGTPVPGLQHINVDIPEDSIRALFEASGVIRTETLAELFDVAVLLTTQPLPSGDRVAVVGHSTALALLVSNALSNAGLPLAQLHDVGTDGSAAEFGAALSDALASDDVDSVVTIFVPPMRRGLETEVADVIRETAAEQRASATVGRPAKPVISVFLGFDGVPDSLAVPGEHSPMRGSIPSYSSPERAVIALERVIRYAAWRTRDAGRVPTLGDVDPVRARRLVEGILVDNPDGRFLTWDEMNQLLVCYGIELVPAAQANGRAGTIAAAEQLGWPVAVKHASAVRLHLADADAVSDAWQSLGLTSSDQVIVQRMAPRGVDTVLRMHTDPSFGSLVSFGVGGVATDLLEDRAYAVVPLTSLDAAEMISGPKAFPLLTGHRGAEPADIGSLVEVALRLSGLADDLPEVIGCELDPLVAAPDAAYVLNAVMKVAPVMSTAALGARRLGSV